jgi:hypothetical protein
MGLQFPILNLANTGVMRANPMDNREYVMNTSCRRLNKELSLQADAPWYRQAIQ